MKPDPSNALLRACSGAALLFACGLGQAASLSIEAGSVSGSFAGGASANGQGLQAIGTVADASGIGTVAGAGDADRSAVLANAASSAQARWLWAASASLDASQPSQIAFQIGAASALSMTGSGQLDAGQDSTGLSLAAELKVVGSNGEALGSPVQIVLSGTADSIVLPSVAAVDAVPFFDLAVRDAQGLLLASWQGMAANDSRNFSLHLSSRVGDSLFFSLDHASQALFAPAAAIGGAGLELSSSALLEGSIVVSAVPEPASWGLVALGLAIVTGMARRTGRC